MTALEASIGELFGSPVFHGMTRDQVSDLCRGGVILTSQHRQVIFRAKDPAISFGIVLSGAYKLTKSSPSGEDAIVHFSIPGEVVGAFIMANANPVYPVTATAMGPSRFLRLPRENYLKYWKQNADLILRVQNMLSERMALLQNRQAMLRAPLNQKVASLLITLLERNDNSDDLALPLPLTRQEIADSLGASVEAVIRVMSDWSKLGLIRTSDQKIFVDRLDEITKLIGT